MYLTFSKGFYFFLIITKNDKNNQVVKLYVYSKFKDVDGAFKMYSMQYLFSELQ